MNGEACGEAIMAQQKDNVYWHVPFLYDKTYNICTMQWRDEVKIWHVF